MINDRPASLVNLLTYSDTEHALLGSRRWFGVNMGFSDEYQILMDILYVVVIRYGAKKISKEFFNKGNEKCSLNTNRKSTMRFPMSRR